MTVVAAAVERGRSRIGERGRRWIVVVVVVVVGRRRTFLVMIRLKRSRLARLDPRVKLAVAGVRCGGLAER